METERARRKRCYAAANLVLSEGSNGGRAQRGTEAEKTVEEILNREVSAPVRSASMGFGSIRGERMHALES
jgi:hypothetical protein